MHIQINTDTNVPCQPVREGNVYPVSGGRGMKNGHMNIVIAITNERLCLCLTVNREGDPVGVTQYCIRYLEERLPIAFVEGLEGFQLVMRSI
jgi:hypothetical protein